MNSSFVTGFDAVRTIHSGMVDLSRAAERSLGPCGRPALVEHVGKLTPNVVKDGAALSRALSYGETTKNVGLKYLVQMAKEIERDFGDGVSTMIVTTSTVIREVVKSLAVGIAPEKLAEGVKLGAIEARAEIVRLQKAVMLEDLESILPSVTFTETSIAKLVSEAFVEVGADGDVRAEIGDGVEDRLEIIRGARFENGYESSAFVTDKASMRVEFDEPFILLTDRVLDDFEAIAPALEHAAACARPLLVIAAGFGEKVRSGLVMNNVRGVVRCAAVKAPAHGDTQSDFVGDLSVLTGARAFLDSQGDSLTSFTPRDLGECERIIVDADTTLIVGGRGSEAEKEARIEHARSQLAFAAATTKSFTGQMNLEEKAEDRIKVLKERYAEIFVGGFDDITMKYRLGFAKKAIGVGRSLLRQGAVPGGGVGLALAGLRLRAVARDQTDAGVRAGLEALALGLMVPRKAIVHNAGGEIARRYLDDLDPAQPWQAVDVMQGRCVDLEGAGIADSIELSLRILDGARSLTQSICRTEVLVLKSRDEIEFSPDEAAATREIF